VLGLINHLHPRRIKMLLQHLGPSGFGTLVSRLIGSSRIAGDVHGDLSVSSYTHKNQKQKRSNETHPSDVTSFPLILKFSTVAPLRFLTTFPLATLSNVLLVITTLDTGALSSPWISTPNSLLLLVTLST